MNEEKPTAAVGHMPFDGHRTMAEVLEIIPAPPRVTVADIKAAVCEHYKLAPERLVSRSRDWDVARPRQVVMYLARRLTKHSTPSIAKWLGGLDHSTVITGSRAVPSRPQQLADANLIEDRLMGRAA